MGWWDAGDGDVVGDDPADFMVDALERIMKSRQARSLPLPTAAELRDAFVAALRDAERCDDRDPEGLVHVTLWDFLYEAPPPAPPEAEMVASFRDALRIISGSYRDTELERNPRTTELVKALDFVLERPSPYLTQPDWYAFTHPLKGVRKPERVSELLARADASGQRLLEDAVRLALWRIAGERRLAEEAGRLTAPPWTGPSIKVPQEPFLTGLDLLRAVLATGGALLEDLFAGVDREEECAVDAARWRSILAEAPLPTDLPLAAVWRGRWALGCAKIPRFDAQGVLGALPPWCLYELIGYSRGWREDQSTESKVLRELHTNQQVLAGWGESIPVAVLARGDLLEVLDHQFVALWLCQRPEIEDVHGKSFDLATLLRALEAADKETRHKWSWDLLEPGLDYPSEDSLSDEWPELLAAAREGHLESWLQERRYVDEDPFYLQYIGNPARVRALLELEAALP